MLPTQNPVSRKPATAWNHGRPVWLGVLGVASFLATLLWVWPGDRGSALQDARESGQQTPTVQPLASAVGHREAAAAPDLQPQESPDEEDPQRIAAAASEPALLDLLEDTTSPDPSVQYEARRLLSDLELSSR